MGEQSSGACIRTISKFTADFYFTFELRLISFQFYKFIFRIYPYLLKNDSLKRGKPRLFQRESRQVIQNLVNSWLTCRGGVQNDMSAIISSWVISVEVLSTKSGVVVAMVKFAYNEFPHYRHLQGRKVSKWRFTFKIKKEPNRTKRFLTTGIVQVHNVES